LRDLDEVALELSPYLVVARWPEELRNAIREDRFEGDLANVIESRLVNGN
jgi:hypothetical protein